MQKLSLILAIVLFSATAVADHSTRKFEFSYRVLAGQFPNHDAVDIFIPLPVENSDQQILETRFRTSMPGEELSEAVHGNRYYQIRRPANINGPIDAEFTWVVERRVVTASAGTLSEEERQRYLAPNLLVPVGHEILAPIQAEIHAMRGDDSASATARAIYDWIVDNVEYKKVGTGWGNGDTFWACSERYGNCTDFHALFVALARSEGIPARFEIGFPVPEDKPRGRIDGYHCWVQFYLPGQGWIPIDASEAAKHPEKRELFYGTHPADRIHLSTGRDLVLSEASKSQPLNYFIYPHVEVGGIPWKVDLETEFSFRELDPG
ncbi:transglutaminase domain-containing protein [Seongchinamella unica]|uniref:Transglutaminase domain-containing protein n=1 Tax=Seongchinamella unica TaxID=2547392 RepID=A0A4R5LSU8_9GAMM|nr:transglutaminase domain-containing protein [Seongchinamella unica]TDG13926.1 transglutaminase domain-containing protein [Seongchinamella unica]